MEGKIGIIASDSELRDSIVELFGNEVKQGRIIIDILDSDTIDEQGKLLEEKGAKVIIARSGGYRHTVGKVNVPVMHLKITTLDILHAIKTAGRLGKDIVLVISQLEYFDIDEWKDMINSRVIIERFDSKDEIEGRVKKYAGEPGQVVVVGGGIPCSFAEKYGIAKVHIGAGKESIHEVVASAMQLVDSLYEQKYRNEVLKTTLDGVHDAVIAVNQEGRIILYNKRAEEALKKDGREVMDKSLPEVFPELGFMMDVLRRKANQINEIINLNRIVITANTSVLEVEGHVLGVLCSFQDITKLQSLEKKIRYELNKKGLIARYGFEDIIARDPVMQDTVKKAIKIGLTDSTLMIYGESGTGKEMIAQSIHNISDRKEEPFVAINCAAITESLLESELFGYEEGAFTGARKGGKPGLFELAHGGTIFLDEINSVSLNLQAKLLRVLEEKEIMRIGSDYVIPLDVKIISAANEKLEERIRDGSFRKDLFYRLSILELHIPPLRERKKDILPIFEFYLSKYSTAPEYQPIHEGFKEKLISYSWPGNVRELRNIAQRYILFGEVNLDENEIIRESTGTAGNAAKRDNDLQLDLKEISRYVEGKVIEMLAEKGMSKGEIARLLGISRTTLWSKQNNNKD